MIALVVTIIILLILAGISIAIIGGENGIIERAVFSKFVTEYTTVREMAELYVVGRNMDEISDETEIDIKSKYPILTDEKVENNSIENSLTETIRITEKIKEVTDKKVELYKVDMDVLNLDIKSEYVINIKTGEVYKLKGVKYRDKIYHNLQGVRMEDETGNSLVDLEIAINQETDELYKCLLTFKVNDENDKIKQIEYIPDDGDIEVVIVNTEKQQEISIPYDIEKTDVDKVFRVITEKGNVILVNTAYTVTYDDNMGQIYKQDKILKGTTNQISITNLAPIKEGKHFLGWSKYETATEPDYFENGEYPSVNKNITFYAIWTEQQSGKVEVIENDSLIGKVSKLNTSGAQNIEVNGITYLADVIIENNDLVLDGVKDVTGATLTDKVYEFGNKETDVAKTNEDSTIANAQSMVILKVNGNLTVNYHTKLTACKSDAGLGGPKGLLVYCTGVLSNNSMIDMTARGAIAQGENVYLWKNGNNDYEYVPADGGAGAPARYIYSGNYEHRIAGLAGTDGMNRQTGGGGEGTLDLGDKTPNGQSGAGSTGTSYSGGSGGGGLSANYKTGAGSGINAKPNGGAGGNGTAWRWSSSWIYRYAGGGAGNPGGIGAYSNGEGNYSNYSGESGTGGLLILYSDVLYNAGSIASNGSNGGDGYAAGGSSGGGSVNVFYRKNCEDSGKMEANGGEYGNGGAGGNGTVTVGNIKTDTFVKDNREED